MPKIVDCGELVVNAPGSFYFGVYSLPRAQQVLREGLKVTDRDNIYLYRKILHSHETGQIILEVNLPEDWELDADDVSFAWKELIGGWSLIDIPPAYIKPYGMFTRSKSRKIIKGDLDQIPLKQVYSHKPYKPQKLLKKLREQYEMSIEDTTDLYYQPGIGSYTNFMRCLKMIDKLEEQGIVNRIGLGCTLKLGSEILDLKAQLEFLEFNEKPRIINRITTASEEGHGEDLRNFQKDLRLLENRVKSIKAALKSSLEPSI